MEKRNVIERAFEIAPECGSIVEVRRRLIGEGYMEITNRLNLELKPRR